MSLILLWLCGACLRVTILAVPPVIPLLHKELHLSESGLGLLSSFPMLLFSLAAIPGALLIARFGIRATLVAGLLFNALGSAARGAVPDVVVLNAATIAMSAGVSVMQPALPHLVRRWFPQRIGFATAIYTNGLIVGEILVVALTRPFVLPLVGDDWRRAFLVWTMPVVATAFLVAIYRRDMRASAQVGPHEAKMRQTIAHSAWWPNWRNPLIWRLGLLFGSINSIYFVANAFLPDYLAAGGHAELIGAALTALNFCQLPASALMLLFAGRLARHGFAYVSASALCLIALVGILATQGLWIVVFAGLLGFAVAVTLILVLALPALLCAPQDVHRTSAAMFTLSYGSAMATSILTGLLWEWTHWPIMGFVPIALYAVLALPIAGTIGRRRGADA